VRVNSLRIQFARRTPVESLDDTTSAWLCVLERTRGSLDVPSAAGARATPIQTSVHETREFWYRPLSFHPSGRPSGR